MGTIMVHFFSKTGSRQKIRCYMVVVVGVHTKTKPLPPAIRRNTLALYILKFLRSIKPHTIKQVEWRQFRVRQIWGEQQLSQFQWKNKKRFSVSLIEHSHSPSCLWFSWACVEKPVDTGAPHFSPQWLNTLNVALLQSPTDCANEDLLHSSLALKLVFTNTQTHTHTQTQLTH